MTALLVSCDEMIPLCVKLTLIVMEQMKTKRKKEQEWNKRIFEGKTISSLKICSSFWLKHITVKKSSPELYDKNILYLLSTS